MGLTAAKMSAGAQQLVDSSESVRGLALLGRLCQVYRAASRAVGCASVAVAVGQCHCTCRMRVALANSATLQQRATQVAAQTRHRPRDARGGGALSAISPRTAGASGRSTSFNPPPRPRMHLAPSCSLAKSSAAARLQLPLGAPGRSTSTMACAWGQADAGGVERGSRGARAKRHLGAVRSCAGAPMRPTRLPARRWRGRNAPRPCALHSGLRPHARCAAEERPPPGRTVACIWRTQPVHRWPPPLWWRACQALRGRVSAT